MKKKVVGIVIIILSVVFISFYTNDKNFITRVVSYNGNELKVSVDGVATNTLPTEGSYYLASYDCKNANTKLIWDMDNYKLSISNGNKKGGISCYLDFQSNPLLTSVEIGSYVKYVGNNGCVGKSCDGQNANYIDDNDMGYCNNSNTKFLTNGWRVAYIKNGSVHLVSAGAPECICTNSNGTISGNNCNSYESTYNTPVHLSNLDKRALRYCNKDYTYDGICNSSSAWSFNQNDFKNITGNVLSSGSCYSSFSDTKCGYNNDLIDNGGYYWYGTSYGDSYPYGLGWSPESRIVLRYYTNSVNGLRPVIKLDSNVVVIGGTGTYNDPYLIGNNTFLVNDGVNEINNSEKINVTLNLMTVNAVKMCISVNTSVCTNYMDYNDTYTLDWSNEEAGEKLIYVYYKDSNDNVIASMNRKITILG